jgi:hypothetical protein
MILENNNDKYFIILTKWYFLNLREKKSVKEVVGKFDFVKILKSPMKEWKMKTELEKIPPQRTHIQDFHNCCVLGPFAQLWPKYLRNQFKGGGIFLAHGLRRFCSSGSVHLAHHGGVACTEGSSPTNNGQEAEGKNGIRDQLYFSNTHPCELFPQNSLEFLNSQNLSK